MRRGKIAEGAEGERRHAERRAEQICMQRTQRNTEEKKKDVWVKGLRRGAAWWVECARTEVRGSEARGVLA